MGGSKRATPRDLVDQALDGVAVSEPQTLASSFLTFERYAMTLPAEDGPVRHQRDLLRVGRVVGVLPLDLARDELVLIRQFRIGAHLATGRGELVEIVAGMVDPGEDIAATARRECEEEIGVTPERLIELFSFLPAPGFSDEFATLFLALIDAGDVPARAGLAQEAEMIVPMRVRVDDALAALDADRMYNGYLVQALRWLAANRHRLDAVIRTGGAAPA